MDDDAEPHHHKNGKDMGDKTDIDGLFFEIIIQGHAGNEQAGDGESQEKTVGYDGFSGKKIQYQHAQKKGKNNGNPPDGGGWLFMGGPAVGDVHEPGTFDQKQTDGDRNQKKSQRKQNVVWKGKGDHAFFYLGLWLWSR